MILIQLRYVEYCSYYLQVVELDQGLLESTATIKLWYFYTYSAMILVVLFLLHLPTFCVEATQDWVHGNDLSSILNFIRISML